MSLARRMSLRHGLQTSRAQSAGRWVWLGVCVVRGVRVVRGVWVVRVRVGRWVCAVVHKV